MSGERKKVYDIKESNQFWRDEPFELVTDTPFTIGQSYTKTKAAKYICKRCGNDKFYVGADDYLTVIMCPNCGWEEAVHDG